MEEAHIVKEYTSPDGCKMLIADNYITTDPEERERVFCAISKIHLANLEKKRKTEGG